MSYELTVQNGTTKKILAGIIATTAWTAIVFQAYLTTGSFGNLFSYFTILTNSLIAISITGILLLPQKRIGLFVKNHLYKKV